MAKSKSRTSTSKKKNLKLKWWYVLPVILVVAISGYAIVRFSEASTSHGYHTPLDKKISGGGSDFTITKNGETTTFRRVTSDSPVRSNWKFSDSCMNTSQGYDCSRVYSTGGDDYFYPADAKGCARVYLEPGSAGTLTYSLDIRDIFLGSNPNVKVPFSLGSTASSYDIRTICAGIGSMIQNYTNIITGGYSLNAKVTVDKGKVGLTNFHLEGN